VLIGNTYIVELNFSTCIWCESYEKPLYISSPRSLALFKWLTDYTCTCSELHVCLLNCICLNKGSFIHYYVWSEFEQLLDITKTESNKYCFITHWMKKKKWKSCFCFFTDSKQQKVCKLDMITGLSLSFESPIALVLTPVTNLLLCGWIVLRTGKFTRNIKGSSKILGLNRCYGLRPSMTALDYL